MDITPSNNGRGSEASITATTVAELAELVGLIDLNVVVFDSANPDSCLAHYDVEHDPGRTSTLPGGPTGMHAWPDLLVRLSRAPVVGIASIRGRARGAGSELVGHRCDRGDRVRPLVRVRAEHDRCPRPPVPRQRRTPGGHGLLEGVPRIYQVTPDVPRPATSDKTQGSQT